MNRKFWNNINNLHTHMINNCTTLKIRVVLQINGRAVECATCTTPRQANDWEVAKRREWAQHTPMARPVFVEQ